MRMINIISEGRYKVVSNTMRSEYYDVIVRSIYDPDDFGSQDTETREFHFNSHDDMVLFCTLVEQPNVTDVFSMVQKYFTVLKNAKVRYHNRNDMYHSIPIYTQKL